MGSMHSTPMGGSSPPASAFFPSSGLSPGSPSPQIPTSGHIPGLASPLGGLVTPASGDGSPGPFQLGAEEQTFSPGGELHRRTCTAAIRSRVHSAWNSPWLRHYGACIGELGEGVMVKTP